VVASDLTVSSDELYRIAEGSLKYETTNPHIVWVSTPIRLADRKVHLADAERIARDGIDVLRKKVESQRDAYRSPGEYERGMGWMTGMGHDALGWVLFAEGKVDDRQPCVAETEETVQKNPVVVGAPVGEEQVHFP